MTIDDTENGWDSLAEDLGIEPKPTAKAETPVPASRPPARPEPARIHRAAPQVEEPESDDFGTGVVEEPRSHAALYDPGPEAVADDSDEFEDASADGIEDEAESDESTETGDDGPPQEGGKKRRRRRRRKKKGGPEGAATEVESVAESDEDDSGVEEGEAPAPLDEDDEEEETIHSAMDDEMEAEAAGPRPVWHVMTWLELVSKLHRPG